MVVFYRVGIAIYGKYISCHRKAASIYIHKDHFQLYDQLLFLALEICLNY